MANRSAQPLVERLMGDGVLHEVTGRQRGRFYLAQAVLDVLELDEVPDDIEPRATVQTQTLNGPH